MTVPLSSTAFTVDLFTQLLGAFEYLKSHPTDPLDISLFEKSCGIGVKYSPDEIEDAVSSSKMYLLIIISMSYSIKVKLML